MKLQLIKTEEIDGTWYKILIDGKVFKHFGMNFISDAQAKQSAEEAYNHLLKKEPMTTQIIREDEI